MWYVQDYSKDFNEVCRYQIESRPFVTVKTFKMLEYLNNDYITEKKTVSVSLGLTLT